MSFKPVFFLSLHWVTAARRGSLMDSALDPGSSVRSSHGREHIALCSSARHLTLTMPGVKMVTGEFNAAGDPVMD